MPDPILMGKAFAAAAALSLAVAVLFGVFSRARVTAAGAVVAVVSAVAAGVWLLDLVPAFPPAEDLDRLLLIVLPAAAVAELAAAASGRLGWVARGAVTALAAPVLLHQSEYVADLSGPGSRTWSPAETWLVFVALAALLLAAWVVLHRLARRTGGRMVLVSVAATTLAAGVVVMMSGYATGGQLGVPLAAGLGGVTLGLLVCRRGQGSEGALGVGLVGLFSLLVVGRLFASLTTVNAALLFAAPLLGCLPELLPARPRVRGALRLVLTAAPVVVALVLAQEKLSTSAAQPEAGVEGTVDDYMNFGK